MIKTIHRFFYAWLFLTKLPAPPLPKATKEDWGRITPYFVLIGFILGFILYFFAKLFVKFDLPVMFSSLLLVLVWNLITGSLHLDGLMDTFDGINCQDPERKMDAMKDSRIGAFGAIAGIFAVLFKLVALCTLLLNKMFLVVLISVPIARLLGVYSLSFLSYSKKTGLSSSLLVAGLKKPLDFLVNLFVFVTIILFLFFKFHLSLFFICFILISIFISLFWTYWLNNHFKGHSGDTYGALIELTEITVLSLAVILKNYL